MRPREIRNSAMRPRDQSRRQAVAPAATPDRFAGTRRRRPSGGAAEHAARVLADAVVKQIAARCPTRAGTRRRLSCDPSSAPTPPNCTTEETLLGGVKQRLLHALAKRRVARRHVSEPQAGHRVRLTEGEDGDGPLVHPRQRRRADVLGVRRTATSSYASSEISQSFASRQARRCRRHLRA